MLQSVLCITINKYLVHVLVVLLHARFSFVSPVLFSIGRYFFSSGHPYIGSTTVLPDIIFQRLQIHYNNILQGYYPIYEQSSKFVTYMSLCHV